MPLASWRIRTWNVPDWHAPSIVIILLGIVVLGIHVGTVLGILTLRPGINYHHEVGRELNLIFLRTASIQPGQWPKLIARFLTALDYEITLSNRVAGRHPKCVMNAITPYPGYLAARNEFPNLSKRRLTPKAVCVLAKSTNVLLRTQTLPIQEITLFIPEDKAVMLAE